MKKIVLSKVLDLQRKLVDEIDADLKEIIRGNSKPKIDVDLLEKNVIKKEDQLVVLKEVVQEANKSKLTRKDRTNNYYIYRRGDLKKRKNALLSISQSKENQWDETAVNKRIRELNQEINQITEKLTLFNNSKKVKVELNPDLDLI